MSNSNSMKPNSITQIIKDMQEHFEETHSYYPLSKIKLEELPDADMYEELTNLPSLFFLTNHSRAILTVWVCKTVRILFEKYKYADINLPFDAYNSLREDYNTKSCNRQLLCEMFGKSYSNCTLSYESFLKYEKKYITEYNKYAPEEYQLSTITHLVPKEKNPVVDLAKDFANNFINRRDYEVLYKRACGYTLDELGSEFNVTRERARQIETKPKLAVARWIEIHHQQIINELCTNGVLDCDKAISVLGEKEFTMIKFILKSEKNAILPLRLDADLDIIFADIDNKYTKALVEATEIPIGNAKETVSKFSQHMISSGFSFFTEDVVLKYFDVIDRHIYGDTISPTKANLGLAIDMLVVAKYPNGIKISDSIAITKFASELQSIYKINAKFGRSLTTRIQDVLIMRDRAVYDSPSRVDLPEDLRNEIYDYLTNMADDRITYTSLFNVFKDKLKDSSNIDNQYYLHGALKYYSEENNFDFLKCYICKPQIGNNQSITHFEKVRDYLLKQGKPVPLSKILEDMPNWNEMFIRYSRIYFPEISIWGDKQYINLSVLKIAAKEKARFVEIINKLTDNKYSYTSIYKVYKYCKENIPDILAKYNIDSEPKLFHTLQYYISEGFFYRRPHILRASTKNTEDFNTDSLIKMIINQQDEEIIDKDKVLKEIGDLYGSTNSSISLSLQRALKDYLKLSATEYIKKESLSLTEKDIEQIKSVITKELKSLCYVVPSKVIKANLLPKVKYDWTSCLLCEVIAAYELPFKVINSVYAFSYNPSSVIVDKDSKFTNKNDILKHMIDNVYNGPMDKISLYRYTKTLEIFHSNITTDEFTAKLDSLNINYTD